MKMGNGCCLLPIDFLDEECAHGTEQSVCTTNTCIIMGEIHINEGLTTFSLSGKCI